MRGQVTVFIILGLVILFVGGGLLLLSSSLKKTALNEAQDDAITNLFKKEALRLYVHQCLAGELDEGLHLLGTQGRIWSDQGGLAAFNEQTGLELDERIAFAITNTSEEKYKYPCDTGTPPQFCQYAYPNTTTFGSLVFAQRTIEGDLSSYLSSATKKCVEKFVEEKLRAGTQLTTENLLLQVELNDEGIQVSAEYPLRFLVEGREFFHLSAFDFFYTTPLKKFLQAAITQPLQWDNRYVDFAYTQATLEEPSFTYGSDVSFAGCTETENYFSCSRPTFADTYQRLGITLQPSELANGDSLYTFSTAQSLTTYDEPFVFRFIRQNRPPALDFVGRNACTNYDYLVIEDHPDLGTIDITLQANDPDEDEAITYAFADIPTGAQVEDNRLQATLPPALYELTASATDEHQATDKQTIRVLVDTSITAGVQVALPYTMLDEQGQLQAVPNQVGETVFVSAEDPVVFRYGVPEDSLIDVQNSFTAEYTHEDDTVTKVEPSPNTIHAGLNKFTVPQPEQLPLSLITSITTSTFSIHPFSQVGKGVLEVISTRTYCGTDEQLGDNPPIPIQIQECYPLKNPSHPFAYRENERYHEYLYEINEEGESVWTGEFESIDPFQATHSCCRGDPATPDLWQLKTPEDSPCFVNPEPGCYGQIEEFTSFAHTRGYILETQQRFCDGNRGNLCNGEVKNDLVNNELRCGFNSQNQCTGIARECQGEKPWSLVDKTVDGRAIKGFCYGTMGCGKFDETPTISVPPNTLVQPGQTFNFYQFVINQFRQDPLNTPTSNTNWNLFTFSGCPEGNLCTDDGNLQFSGECAKGSCTEN